MDIASIKRCKSTSCVKVIIAISLIYLGVLLSSHANPSTKSKG